ncbi:hypothetical protein JOQ06_006353 [Pogonophryne albipinna]|uniref:Fibronectin type-III domain-containing protein n=1 Tax=Pogonophryne albipinna TaxID=1090488 RepID=A0AAD6BH41_9TELE|nr:hypothetical protein JOQ06_006353 [Pogonophryne albipinna]
MRINAAMNLSSTLWRILIVLLCFSIKLYSLQIKRRGLLTVKPAKLFLIGSNLTVYCHPEKCKNGFKLSLEVNGETVTSSEEVNCPAIFNLINFRTPFSSVICMLKGPDSSKIVDGGDLYGGLPPDKPENITCERTRSSDNIICSWEKGQKTHVITTYNISLNRENGTRVELYQIQDDEQRVSANPLTISRAVIEENIKYKFIITAYNHFGESQSDPFIFCSKDIVIPETPRIVNIEFRNNSQAAVLQWETSDSSEHLRSDVRLRTDKAPSWVKSNYKAEGADLNEGQIRVSGLRPLTDYEFQMRTCMPHTNTPRFNCSKWSASVRGRSPGKGPSQQLHVWRTFDSPGSNVTVLWKPPSPEDYSGVVQQYKIFLGNEQKQEVLSGPASSSVPVPAEIKAISISAITLYGTSPPAVVPLKHSGGFAPVLRELAPAANSSAVLVSWTWTDDKHWSTSDPLHYVVQWTTVPGAQMKWQRVSKDQNNTLITGLRAGVRYNVSLYAVTSRGVSAPSSRLVYSKEQKPVSGPNLSVLVHESRRVHIQWDELPVDQQRGFITHYTVYLQTLYSSNTKLSDRVVMLEASVDTYKRKLENLGDLKRQMKLLEENNMTYMQNTVSLEEELRKANAARAQLETYKRQVQELHRKLSEESRRADNLAYEMKKIEEKHETVMKEKERTIIERDSLKETNEELRCTQAQQVQLSQAGILPSSSPSHENLAAELIPIEYREKFIRLQHENKMLRVQQEELEGEKIAALQAQLEEAHKTRSELDTENRLSGERMSELQQQVEDLQRALQSQAAKPDDSNLKRKLDAHM